MAQALLHFMAKKGSQGKLLFYDKAEYIKVFKAAVEDDQIDPLFQR